MLKITFPIVRSILIKHKLSLLVLIFISILLGIVPTIKSELESGILSLINDSIRAENLGTFSMVMERPISFFITNESADLPEKIVLFLFGNDRVKLGYGVIIYIAITVFSISLGILLNIAQAGIVKRVFAGLRGEGLRKALLIEPGRLSSLPNAPGQYAAAIQQGASNTSNTYNYLLQAGSYIFSLITTLYLVATKSFAFAVSCLILVAIQAAISFIQARRLQDQRTQLDQRRNELVARTDDILSKREILMAYEQGDKYKQKLDGLSLEYGNIERNLDIKEEIYGGISSLTTDIGRLFILLVVLFIVLYINRESIANIGDVYFFISLYVRIFVPASNLMNRYDSIKRAEATSKTFIDVLAYDEKSLVYPHTNKSLIEESKPNHAVVFDAVYFRYTEKHKWILNECSFDVPIHKTTLIVGRSGSGKTTIAKIMLGFWPISRGNVSILGRKLDEWNPHALREKMSYVSQGDHIIDETIRENLAWAGHHEISDEEMIDEIMTLGIASAEHAREILSQPAKNLSIGQQQRLSIARMLLDESELVILDEPLSGVDIFTTRDLLPHLVKVMKNPNRTVIMFSHRLAFAAFSDHIIVLGERGSIIEEGSPKELLNRNGTFASLYKAALAELEYGNHLDVEVKTISSKGCLSTIVSLLIKKGGLF